MKKIMNDMQAIVNNIETAISNVKAKRAVEYSIDGNQVCATYSNFRDLQLDPAGFGDSLKEAFLDLLAQEFPNRECLKSWELEWVQ